MSKVGVIGAGKVGSHIASSLLSYPLISSVRLSNRSPEHLLGRVISLQLCAHILRSHATVGTLDTANAMTMDLLVIALKDDYDPREIITRDSLPSWVPRNLRYAGLINDLPLIKQVCEPLKHFRGRVAVVSNPVEIMTYFVSKWLPHSQVFGLGATIDAARISYFIKREYNRSVDWNACIVAGEHGNQLIPIQQFWQELGPEISEPQLKHCIESAKDIGVNIVRNLGFTLQDCLPLFVEDVLWLLGMGAPVEYKSMARTVDDSCVSIPIRLEANGSIQMFQEYSAEEKREIASVTDRIADLLRVVEQSIPLR